MMAIISIMLVPMVTNEDNTLYWWSRQAEFPYRVGEKGIHWGGPFSDTKSAIREAVAAHPDSVERLRFTSAQTLRIPWPVRAERFLLAFALPRDSFSEGIYASLEYGMTSTSDFREFIRGLSAEADVPVSENTVHPLITGVSIDKSAIKKVSRTKGHVLFQLPVEVAYCHKEAVAPNRLSALLTATVSVKERYPRLEALLRPLDE